MVLATGVVSEGQVEADILKPLDPLAAINRSSVTERQAISRMESSLVHSSQSIVPIPADIRNHVRRVNRRLDVRKSRT